MIDCIIGFKGIYLEKGEYISLDCDLSEHLKDNVIKCNDHAFKKVKVSLVSDVYVTTTYSPAYKIVNSGWYIIDYIILPSTNMLFQSTIYIEMRKDGLSAIKDQLPTILKYFERYKTGKHAYVALALKSEMAIKFMDVPYCTEPESTFTTEVLGKFDFHSHEVVPYEEPFDWLNDAEEILKKIENQAYDPAIVFAESKSYSGESLTRLINALGDYITKYRSSNDVVTFGSAARKYAMNIPANDSTYFDKYVDWLSAGSGTINPEAEMELVKGLVYRLMFGDDKTNISNIIKNYEDMKDTYSKIASVLFDIASAYSNSRILSNPIYANTYIMAVSSLCIIRAIEMVADKHTSGNVKPTVIGQKIIRLNIPHNAYMRDELCTVISDMEDVHTHESLLLALSNINKSITSDDFMSRFCIDVQIGSQMDAR